MKHGTVNRGERAGRSKLTEADVRQLRCRKAAGEKINCREEAAKLGVSDQSISAAVNVKTWKHLAPPDQLHGQSAATDQQPPRQGERELTTVEKLLNLWSQLTEGERREFLSRIQGHGTTAV
jgi:hypothetical protein